MLSKIKASPVAETRSSISRTSQVSDLHDIEDMDNDSNNNNNNNINNNQQSKKTQDELLDIVDVSRKRRLSKESADSLTSFIRWSFSHIDPSMQRTQGLSNKYNIISNNNNNTGESGDQMQEDHLDEDILDDEDSWQTLASHQQQYSPTANKFQAQQEHHMLLRRQQQAKHLGGGSSTANLALMIKNSADRQSLYRQQSSNPFESGARQLKRARTNAYSPDSKFAHSPVSDGGYLSSGMGTRKSSNYLGNVVERLHQQQQKQQQQNIKQESQQQAIKQESPQQEASSDANLSFHLQQFLQQQTSLEDLCSSVGLDDSNQLVLAAAIHRALVDSMGPNQLADAKSVASSTGSSAGGSSSSNNNNNNNNTSNNNNNNMSTANSNVLGSQINRAHNTRSSLQGLTSTSAMNMSNRAQQQRHAQAAAALSALASAGSHSTPHHQTTPGANPMVDFECETCGSSFDDRHRLMQHQSIHLELKKDWFTETPVDEVMKIFNRRRGEFLCNTCNLRFEATFDYDKHNHSVHGQRPYCCQFCGNGTRTFRFWRQYLNHLYDHRYIFSCTIDDCDFTVNRRDSLRFHIFRFHLNCQLPQNQLQGLRSGHNMLLGANNCDDDNDNEMNVGE